MRKRSGRGGFSLIELLVVVAIIAILAMIAIMNYWLGVQRARQKRTMSDMRSIATAWEARGADMKGYNAAGWDVPTSVISNAEVDALLTPTYLKSVVHLDGWNHPLEFSLDQAPGAIAAQTYAIRSAGADQTFEGSSYTSGTTTKFDCDIVYSNGSFVSYPSTQ